MQRIAIIFTLSLLTLVCAGCKITTIQFVAKYQDARGVEYAATINGEYDNGIR